MTTRSSANAQLHTSPASTNQPSTIHQPNIREAPFLEPQPTNVKDQYVVLDAARYAAAEFPAHRIVEAQMTDRRHFLRTVAGAAGAMSVGRRLHRPARAGSPRGLGRWSPHQGHRHPLPRRHRRERHRQGHAAGKAGRRREIRRSARSAWQLMDQDRASTCRR